MVSLANGSEVTIKVSVFDTRKGPGHRWEGVKVDKLVEYVPANATAVAATGNAAPALPF